MVDFDKKLFFAGLAIALAIWAMVYGFTAGAYKENGGTSQSYADAVEVMGYIQGVVGLLCIIAFGILFKEVV